MGRGGPLAPYLLQAKVQVQPHLNAASSRCLLRPPAGKGLKEGEPDIRFRFFFCTKKRYTFEYTPKELEVEKHTI